MYKNKLFFYSLKGIIILFIKTMYETLLEKVKATIDERKMEREQDRMLIRGWTFSDEHGVCPIRCKYEATIKGVDIELRKDVCDHFGRNNLILSGWKIYVPLNKYVDLQIKLGSDWVTFVSTNTLVEKIDSIQSMSSAPIIAAPAPLPAPLPASAPTPSGPVGVTTSVPESMRVSLATNPSPLSHVFVVDQFYQQPDEVRAFGLSITKEGKPSPSFHSNSPLKEQFENILGRKIRSFEKWPENGQFSLTQRSESAKYEVHRYQYGGVVFLTPNAPITSGITLYRSKTSKQQTMEEAQLASIPTNQLSTELEPVDVIGNVYNRLVLFNTKMIHAVSHHFGNEHKDGRLIQRFAFDLQ
jgi:hypothetical protein